MTATITRLPVPDTSHAGDLDWYARLLYSCGMTPAKIREVSANPKAHRLYGMVAAHLEAQQPWTA